MPRNNTGTYSLPGGVNPVATGTLVSAKWANPTMDDIAQALTDSLDRNGNGGMLAPFKNADGTVSLPGMTWANETDSGWYRAAAADMRAAINGVVTTKHIDDSASTAGEQHPFLIWDGSAFFEPLTSDDGATPAFTTLTSEGAVTITAGGLTVTTGGATVTAGGATITGDSSGSADVSATGALTPDFLDDYYYGFIDNAGNIDIGKGITSVVKSANQYTVTFDGVIGGGGTPTPQVWVTAGVYSGVPTYAVIEGIDSTSVNVKTYEAITNGSSIASFTILAKKLS